MQAGILEQTNTTKFFNFIHLYRMPQYNISELVGGVGCTLMTRNPIAKQGRKCFSDVVDGIIQKFRAFLLGIVISHKDAQLVGWLIIWKLS